MTRISHGRWEALALVSLIGVGVVARVVWSGWIAHAYPAGVRSADTQSYLGSARALIDSGRFTLSPGSKIPMYVRTPGYPAFVAAILWVTKSRWAVSPVQAAFSLFTVALTVFVGRRVIGLTAGLVAGALLVLDPLQFRASGTILTESLTSFALIAMVAAGILVFERRPKDVSLGAALLLGVLVAVATMIRPTMWFFPAVVLVLLVVRFRSVPWRTLLALFVVFLLPIVLVVGGWQARNNEAVGSWQLSGASGNLLYCYDAATVQAKVEGTSVDAARHDLGCTKRGACLPCRIPDVTAKGQGYDEWGHKGLVLLSKHPVETALVIAEGGVREIAGPGTDYVRAFFHIGASTPLAGALAIWNVALWALAAVGAVAGLRSRRRAFWTFVIATIGYVLVISAGAEADARFRTPIIPLLALLAALGLQSIVRFVRASKVDVSRTRDTEHGADLTSVP